MLCEETPILTMLTQFSEPRSHAEKCTTPLIGLLQKMQNFDRWPGDFSSLHELV